MTRLPVLAFLAAVLSASHLSAAGSAELLVVTRDGCPWCERWKKEIAPIYPKTVEGRTAPLREVNISRGWPLDLAAIDKELFTPTFILVEAGIEIDRMRGYAGDEFFWFLLGEMLDQLPATEVN